MGPHLAFPPFTLDVHRRLLCKDGQPVDLSPRLVEILAHLAEHAGETISKDALLDRFWADVHVTENTLTRAIADIRKALEDDAGEPRFVQTMARRGYRFIASVAPHVPVAPAPPKAAAGPDPFADWVKGRLSLETLDAVKLADAIAAFEHAVAAMPDYAPAHAGLANARFLQYELTRPENVPDRDTLGRATVHARRACELDPSLGEAWATLGFVLTAAGDVDQARAAARRAAQLEPSSWRHHFRLAIATWGEERLRAADRTLTLLPDFAPARFVAAMVFIARQAFGTAEEIVVKGAASQSRQADEHGALFPAFGLHWLHGLLLLRRGEVGGALLALARELDEAHQESIYYREFRVNALVAAGYAHLTAADPPGAVEAFRAALALLPGNGRALIGLHQAFARTGLAPEAGVILPRISQSLSELVTGGRLAEAAMIKAASDAARGDHAGAIRTLEQLLHQAPVGHVGWIIPIDPALAPLREQEGFDHLLARLATRAS